MFALGLVMVRLVMVVRTPVVVAACKSERNSAVVTGTGQLAPGTGTGPRPWPAPRAPAASTRVRPPRAARRTGRPP